ncbi:MAG: 2Fe-2S iron-sulfur cluster-binding protein [Treponema sp.]|nr:2Fe-2S iron-sulfur cluster-binding protein [Treponema sp.]
MKHKVIVQDTDIVFDCEENVSVLDAMIRNGKGPVKHGCCGGGCGVCKARIISGDFYAFKPMSAAHIDAEEKKGGFALLCCVQPRSDLVIAVR